MLSRRRLFAGCAVCAAAGLIATGADAQAPAATRTILQTADVPGTNMVTLNVLLDMPPGGTNPRHTHPGVAMGYVLAGDIEFTFADRKVTLRPGESLTVPPEVPHVEVAGPAGVRVLVTFTIEKGKPLASPAPG